MKRRDVFLDTGRIVRGSGDEYMIVCYVGFYLVFFLVSLQILYQLFVWCNTECRKDKARVNFKTGNFVTYPSEILLE